MKLTEDQTKQVYQALEHLAGGVLYYRDQKNSASTEHGILSFPYKRAHYLERAFLDAQRPLEALLDHTNDE